MNMTDPLARFARVKTFMFDVDGVMTDGSILVTETGEFLRTMHTRDGYAIKQALRQGFRMVIITGGTSAGVEQRLRLLGIPEIYAGVADKLSVYQDWLRSEQVDPASILYMGDDLPDYEVMQEVGLPCCPSDADPAIQAISAYHSPFPGGKGCVRDVIEKTLRLQGKWSLAGDRIKPPPGG